MVVSQDEKSINSHHHLGESPWFLGLDFLVPFLQHHDAKGKKPWHWDKSMLVNPIIVYSFVVQEATVGKFCL